jgi:hypothetical protein
MLGQVSFESFGKFTARQQYPPPTTFALQPDIRAKTRDNPLIGSTGMLFSEAKMIVEA